MNIELVREALHNQPFQPFDLRLADGRSLHVPHPDFVAVSNRRVVVIDPLDRGMSVLEPLLIVSIEIAAPAPSTAPPEANGSQPQGD
jgi:hypothetical protein